MVNMTNAENLKFTSLEAYRINVKGCLDEGWSDRFSGMLIENHTSGTKTPIAVLQGKLLDQTQLLGVLNNLYEMYLSLISVELIKTDIEENSTTDDSGR